MYQLSENGSTTSHRFILFLPSLSKLKIIESALSAIVTLKPVHVSFLQNRLEGKFFIIGLVKKHQAMSEKNEIRISDVENS